MLKARAIKSFRRSDQRTWVKRGQEIEGADDYIKALERVGNVRITKVIVAAPENKAHPKKDDGEKSSASPAVRVLQGSKSNKSKSGKKKTAKKKTTRKKSTKKKTSKKKR